MQSIDGWMDGLRCLNFCRPSSTAVISDLAIGMHFNDGIALY